MQSRDFRGQQVFKHRFTAFFNYDDTISEEEVAATLSLMQAAPDLLEALKRIARVASVELTGRRDDVLEQARAAIAKAEGGGE
jgi:hypothetical protein